MLATIFELADAVDLETARGRETYAPGYHLAQAREGYYYEYSTRFGAHYYHMFVRRSGAVRAVPADYPQEPELRLGC